MSSKLHVILALILLLSAGCAARKNPIEKKNTNKVVENSASENSIKLPESNENQIPLKSTSPSIEVSDTTFVNLKDYSNDFVYNMKYATSDNFLHSKVYECQACYLRYKTVKSLIKANEKLMKKGFRIMLFDCYRPISIQKKMWAIVSNPNYVADPKKGSIHNRGGAVDITLVNAEGKELDMGTPFDFFGIEASHDYENLSDEVKSNRRLLRKIMTQNNFKIFESEWWHYNLKNAQKDAVSNFNWNCN